MAGAVLAGEIVQELNATLHTSLATTFPASRLTIQFGPYATFMSFFGLSQAIAASPDFYGIVDYASSFIIELVTDAEVASSAGTGSNTVNPEELYVRFLFANGTASDDNPPKAFPLFGQNETKLRWTTFISEMDKFSLTDIAEWCVACEATEGVCSNPNGSGVSAAENSADRGGISNVLAGVCGAVVTLVVLLGLGGMVFWFAGLRVVNKKALELSTVVASKASRDDSSSVEHV